MNAGAAGQAPPPVARQRSYWSAKQPAQPEHRVHITCCRPLSQLAAWIKPSADGGGDGEHLVGAVDVEGLDLAVQRGSPYSEQGFPEPAASPARPVSMSARFQFDTDCSDTLA
jgi:hypothetical protein